MQHANEARARHQFYRRGTGHVHARDCPSGSVADAVIGSAFAAISALSWSLLLLAVTHALVTRGTALVRWLVELSYPVYLVHFLPVMLVGAVLIGKGYSQPIVVVGTVILTFMISVVTYYVLIKFTPLSWIVNGYDKSWLKLPSARKSARESVRKSARKSG